MVMLGGALGAILRYAIHQNMPSHINFLKSPGILIANALGCLMLGIFQNSSYAETPFKYFISIGFLGAFTTFSTFVGDIFLTQQKNGIFLALIFISLHLIIGALMYSIGLYIGKTVSYG
jgi:fluoride exporter